MEKSTFADSKTGNFQYGESNSQAAPPPSYSGSQSQIPVDNRSAPSYETSAYPPLPHHTQAPSLTLNIKYESWRKSKIQVLAADNTTILYAINLGMRKPHMTIRSASSDATLGTVAFHSLTNRIDTTVNGSSIPLTSAGVLKNGHKWTSPARGNVEFIWKSKLRNLDLTCVDERGVPIARFKFPNWSLRKVGTFEMLGPDVAQGAIMEELLVTGMAMVEYTMGLVNVSVAAAS
jgi:hypothetical protein